MKFINILPDIIFILLYLILLPDVYGSNATIYKYFHVQSYDIATGLFVILVLLRGLYKRFLTPWLKKINAFAIFPFFYITSAFLIIFDYFTIPNYVYSLTHIQYTQLFIIAVFSGLIVILQQPDNWFKTYYKQIFFWSAPVLFSFGLLLSLLPFDQFIHLSQEDRAIENIQFIVLCTTLFFASKTLLEFYKQKWIIHFFIFLIAATILLFLTGEEISWGQRIFHIENPEFFSFNNVQNEISIHNLSIFDRKIDLAYLCISFYGILSLFLKKLSFFNKNLVLRYYIFPWYTSSYFAITFLFYLYNGFNQRFGYWDEFMELMIYIGVCFSMVSIYFQSKRTEV